MAQLTRHLFCQQPDHAIIMCKFAADCLRRMDALTRDLSDTLGEDTAKLGMRVGIHSGPVTAGVLRGQKSRFQLFGDTVNTAARMESHGIKGRIQVSESAAQELMARNKGHWLIPREDKIQAKGKGELQTYWIHIDLRSTTRGTSHGGTSVSQSSASGGDDGRGASDNMGDPTSIKIQVLAEKERAPDSVATDQNYSQWREKLKAEFESDSMH